ncbi:MAG TPA: riboflavin synthase [Thermoanaerobaculia bacterium]|nr:riboflavin synthase [Thermoanaerobaculia bacterium]
MFSGIVSATGRVDRIDVSPAGARLAVRPPARFGRFRRGESISVSGVCLTALAGSALFRADLSPETLRKTTLGELRNGDAVNLERAVRLADRLSGHLVSGHVDGIARVVSVEPEGDSWIFRFAVPRALGRYVIEKGSVALDGISLTAIGVRGGRFSVAVIPHTFRATTLRGRRPGSRLNFEADMIARWVESLLRR